jgi:glyoxylase-like metal-dependent hydrolase (beta-lactamase superfamily II)
MPDPLQVSSLPLGPLQANCFLVIQGSVGLVIDPGDEAGVVIAALRQFGVRPAAILVTHDHFDHVGAVAALTTHYDVPVYVGAPDAEEIAEGGLGGMAGVHVDPISNVHMIRGEQELSLPLAVTALPTPGHSPGSYTFAIDGQLFCGDLLFRGSIGRTDLPGGDRDQLLDAVAMLVRRFPPDAVVHCGHGPDTSLGRELATNPYLAPLRHDPEHHW